MMTWYVGMATMVMIGVMKVVMSFLGAVGAEDRAAGRACSVRSPASASR